MKILIFFIICFTIAMITLISALISRDKYKKKTCKWPNSLFTSKCDNPPETTDCHDTEDDFDAWCKSDFGTDYTYDYIYQSNCDKNHRRAKCVLENYKKNKPSNATNNSFIKETRDLNLKRDKKLKAEGCSSNDLSCLAEYKVKIGDGTDESPPLDFKGICAINNNMWGYLTDDNKCIVDKNGKKYVGYDNLKVDRPRQSNPQPSYSGEGRSGSGFSTSTSSLTNIQDNTLRRLTPCLISTSDFDTICKKKYGQKSGVYKYTTNGCEANKKRASCKNYYINTKVAPKYMTDCMYRDSNFDKLCEFKYGPDYGYKKLIKLGCKKDNIRAICSPSYLSGNKKNRPFTNCVDWNDEYKKSDGYLEGLCKNEYGPNYKLISKGGLGCPTGKGRGVCEYKEDLIDNEIRKSISDEIKKIEEESDNLRNR